MKAWFSAFIFSIAIVLTAFVLAKTWRNTHETKETIKAIGLAEKNFTSDIAVWNGSFTSHSMTLQETYADLKKNADVIRQYLLNKGVQTTQMIFSAVTSKKDYKSVYDKNTNQNTQVFDGYTLTQGVSIESNEVDKIETISREITELLNKGIDFESNEPHYYYTKLSELKLELLASATADARTRAEQIAKNAAGGRLGVLRNAQMGIFQITGQNSDEEYSDRGTFNTSSKNKKASVTARVEFAID